MKNLFLETVLNNLFDKECDVIVYLSSSITYSDGYVRKASCGNHLAENYLWAIENGNLYNTFCVETIHLKDDGTLEVTLFNSKDDNTEKLSLLSNRAGWVKIMGEDWVYARNGLI